MRNLFQQYQKKVRDRERSQSSQDRTATVERQKKSVLSAAITEDLSVLKGMKSKAKKAQHKKKLVEKYAERVTALCKQKARDDEILGFYLVWLFDAGLINEAVKFADYCLKHGVKTPDIIKRDTETFIYDAVFELAEHRYNTSSTIFEYFYTYLNRVDSADIPDEVKGNFWRLAGLFADKDGNFSDAVDSYKQALSYGASVKTRLSQAEKKLEQQEQ